MDVFGHPLFCEVETIFSFVSCICLLFRKRGALI